MVDTKLIKELNTQAKIANGLNEILEKSYCISLNRSISPEKKHSVAKKPSLTPQKKPRIKEVREGKV